MSNIPVTDDSSWKIPCTSVWHSLTKSFLFKRPIFYMMHFLPVKRQEPLLNVPSLFAKETLAHQELRLFGEFLWGL